MFDAARGCDYFLRLNVWRRRTFFVRAITSLTGHGILPGAEIASFDPVGNFVTMTLPATDSASINLQVTGDNAGTLIIDSEGTPQCWQKANYRGESHE